MIDIDIDIAMFLLATLAALTPIYSMMYDIKKDMGDMKGNISKLTTTISLCPYCTQRREITARRE